LAETRNYKTEVTLTPHTSVGESYLAFGVTTFVKILILQM